jgi:hypothetical protein
MSKIKECQTLIQQLNQIELNRLNPLDILWIQTEHHLYSFTVNDPSLGAGILCGGTLGEKSVCATLLPAPKGEADSQFNYPKISTGNRIVFLFQSGIELLRITTSVVTNLSRLTHKAYLAEI